jgi:hypothetical protein
MYVCMYVFLVLFFPTQIDHVFISSFTFVNSFKNPVENNVTCNRTCIFGFYKKLFLTRNFYMMPLRCTEFVA